MRKRSFFLFAAILAYFCHDGAHAQTVHMGPTSSTFTEGNTTWTPNTCSNWQTFNNPGTFPGLIYNSPAYTKSPGVPIICSFALSPGEYRIVIHLIEAVKSFNAPQKRVFSITSNGDPVLTNVDVFARAGAVETPYDVSTMANPDTLGNLVISFNPVKSSAMFAGIELIQVSQSINLINPGGPSLDGVSSIQMGDGLTLSINPPIVTINVNPSKYPSRVQLQSGLGTPLTGIGNPQICQASTMDGLMYSVGCSTPLFVLDPLQVLYLKVPTANTGPVMLSIDSLPAQPLTDLSGNQLAAGNLAPGMYQIWNDSPIFRLFYTIPPAANAKVWTCNGSGPGWDCSGLKMVQIPQPDGGFHNILGTPSSIALDSKWSLQ